MLSSRLSAPPPKTERKQHNKLDVGYRGFTGARLGGTVESEGVPDEVIAAAMDRTVGEAVGMVSPKALVQLGQVMDKMPPTGVSVSETNNGKRLVVRRSSSVYDAAWKLKVKDWMRSRGDSVRWHHVKEYYPFEGTVVFPQIFFVDMR